MRDDEIKLDRGPEPAANGFRRWRVGQSRIDFGNRRRLGFLLAILIVSLWLPISRPVPQFTPMSWARGSGEPPIARLAYSPDGTTIATTYHDGRAALWTRTDQRYNRRLFNVSGHAHVLAFSPVGRWLFLGGAEPDVVVCDLDRSGLEHPLGITDGPVNALRISPDGRTLAVPECFTNDIILWDVDASRPRLRLRGHQSSAVSLAFTPDGRTLASASLKDHEVFIWDVGSGHLIRRFTGPPRPALCLVYSPDGRLLVTASGGEYPVRIWDAKTGNLVRMIDGHHTQFVQSLAFSPGGRLLATGAGDGVASLWSVASGREICRLDSQADWITAVAFSPDGRTVAATGNDGDIRFWDAAHVVGGPIDS